jgi:nucleoside-diphosphate-sugar epimerase
VKILVTGHGGYIGAVLAPFLARAGHDVTGVDTMFYDGCDLFEPEQVETVRADVRDLGRKELGPYDAVVHLAALSNDPLGDLDRELTLAINFEATVRLAHAAKEAGVGRFVFASSCSMYGAAADGEPVDEDAPLRPLTAYAESKVRAEEALAELSDGGFAAVSMRNATAYGASPRLRLDIVLNNLVGWAVTTGRVLIMSDGTPWRPLAHVEDIARATLAFLQAPTDTIAGEAFNVGADSANYRVRDLAEIVRRAVGGCDIEYAGTGDPDPRSYRVDFGKLRRAFPELELTWTAYDGAEELVRAYRRAGMTFEDFDGPRYTRLKRLRRLAEEGAIDDELRWR